MSAHPPVEYNGLGAVLTVYDHVSMIHPGDTLRVSQPDRKETAYNHPSELTYLVLPPRETAGSFFSAYRRIYAGTMSLSPFVRSELSAY